MTKTEPNAVIDPHVVNNYLIKSVTQITSWMIPISNFVAGFGSRAMPFARIKRESGERPELFPQL